MQIFLYSLLVVTILICVFLPSYFFKKEKECLAQKKRDMELEINQQKLELTQKEHNFEKIIDNILLEMESTRNVFNEKADNLKKEIEELLFSRKLEIFKVERLKKQIKSLKRLYDGYDDKYIIPREELHEKISGLYGYADFPAKLDAARANVSMSKPKLRKGRGDLTSIHGDDLMKISYMAFDSFCELCIRDVKSSNVGKLSQKIRDYATVLDGLSGAGAIWEKYVYFRIQELGIISDMNYVGEMDMEDRKREREELREEQKARREIERAIKESDLRESELRRKIDQEKRKAANDRINEEKRKMYESRILELEERLEKAIEDGQRAKSMAEQTRMGYVYIISNKGSFGEDMYKIGMTRRLEPMDRVRELGDASVPFAFDVHALVFSDDAPSLENDLHKKLALYQVNKVNRRKEFFKAPLSVIQQVVDELHLPAQWKDEEWAKEYRESVKIDQLIMTNGDAKEDWLRRNLHLEEWEEIFEED